MKQKFVVWFNQVDKEDGSIVGGKGANLGEMTQAGFPVPPGFIVTAQAYYHFLDETGLRDKFHQLLDHVDVNDSKQLEKASKDIEKAIVSSPFPKELATEIIQAYFSLEKGILKHPLVAVRSSATAEDLPGASFAGQQSTYLNVQGESNLIEKIREAWASLFTARAIFYRATNNFDHFKVGIAIPVQKMVESDASGIMFTINPVTNDKSTVMIEAIYGLGEMIVQGAVTPDHFEVNKHDMVITDKQIHVQESMMEKKGRENVTHAVPKAIRSRQKITDAQVLALAAIGKKLEHHYYFPQDIEWAIEDGVVYIVQTRPVTTTGKEAEKESTDPILKKHPILTGDPASPGIASGIVKKLASAKEINRIVPGDVLVAEMTNPDYVPAMRKAVAIVTEKGGRTSHAAIVSRELGIPAVVGAKGAKKVLKDGEVITVNGATGDIYKGAMASQPKKVITVVKPSEQLKTATKVYVNLAEAERASVVSKLNVDGVGLLRAEFMIADVGTHPKKLIKDKKQKLFIDSISQKLEMICDAFSPRPVVYRATDFKTNEYRNLKGGEEFEPVEPNPMLGFRGAARYIANPDVFELEMEVFKTVRNKMGHKNLHLMIPFVRSPKELLEVKKLVAGCGLLRSSNFKLWMMVEIPTNVIRLDDFLDVGIDGVSIGSNDLTMLTLGTDRDNSEVASAFSEMDESVQWSLERIVRTCVKRKVTASICGQAASDYPELVDKLVTWGVTSVSVNPDAVDQMRQTVYEAEHRLLKRKE